MKRLFTSESVTEGHPDKVCDQIADAILDDILTKDPGAHVACEVCATTGVVFVMGEITADCYSDISKIARDVIKDVGYDITTGYRMLWQFRTLFAASTTGRPTPTQNRPNAPSSKTH